MKGSSIVYFFKRNRYLRYRIGTDHVDVGPVEISKFWTHLPAEFQSDLDVVVNWGNGKVYFFKHNGYVRYDIATDHVDVGPVEISKFWTHLPAEFQLDIGAAVNWTFPLNLADLMRGAGLTVIEEGNWRNHNRGNITPVGIMEHHTRCNGPNCLNDVIHGDASLQGPKANFYVDRGGGIHIISDGRANHADDGVPTVLNEVLDNIAPPDSAKNRGLNDQKGFSGNRFFFGFENENLGDGHQLWPDVQLNTMTRAAAALCWAHGWNQNRIIAHREWTSRKIDPLGIDMANFRNSIQVILQGS